MLSARQSYGYEVAKPADSTGRRRSNSKTVWRNLDHDKLSVVRPEVVCKMPHEIDGALHLCKERQRVFIPRNLEIQFEGSR
jgi:hypothetical protein